VIVCLTPALGTQLDAWRDSHQELVMAMPAVAAEVSEHNLAYWSAPAFWGAPSTLIEQRDSNPALLELVSLLRRARLPVDYVTDARARTLANTVALFPVHVAIYLDPSFRRWLGNRQLLAELADAIPRARRLAVRVGYVDWSLRLLAVWMSSAWRIRVVVWLMLHLAPRLCTFLEHHFGPKLAEQHAILQRDVEVLARQYSLPAPLPSRWVANLTR
jgi:2-dehydropantoate 2-reductase